MKRMILAALSIALMAGPAMSRPLTEEAKSKAHIMVMVSVSEDVCTSYHIDLKKVGFLIGVLMPDVEVDDDDFQSYAYSQLSRVQQFAMAKGEDAFCMDLYRIFGPGTKISGIMGPAMTRKD